MKVVKFGGSSVSGSEQFKKVKDIVLSDPQRKIVIVSAAGKRTNDDHKLTDLLYLCHAHLTYGVSCEDILEQIKQRFIEIRDNLGLKYDVEKDFSIFASSLSKDSIVDEVVSRGEYFTAKLMAEYLGYTFVDAKDCIFFGMDGALDKENTYKAIKDAYDKYGRILIPGFYGKLPNGRIKVMTRGGSDITGSLAAAATMADIYENWTDVSGILMADPKIVKDPKPIPQITFEELRALAYMGASVLHEESISPVREKGIPLNIRNTNRPQDAGTIILEKIDATKENEVERPITGISGKRNYAIITICKHNMDASMTLRQALEIFDNFHSPVEQITLGMDSFAFIVASKKLENVIYDLISQLRKNCHPDDINIEENISLIAAVGHKMTSKPGTSGKLFAALGQNGVNIRTIHQGADEISIIVGVENKNFETAIKVLYEGFAG